MSCNYCDGERELFAGAEDMGCAIESIRVERVCVMPGNMCGARLTEGGNR